MKKKYLIILVFFLLFSLLYICNIDNIPSSIIVLNNEKINIRKLYGITLENEKYVNVSSGLKDYNRYDVNVNLLGFTVKKIDITEIPEMDVIPVGKIVGLKLYTDGILVVGKEDEYSKVDIKEGDIITEVDGKEIKSIKDLKKILKSSEGKEINIKYLRDGKGSLETLVKPSKTIDGEYKIGLWVKEGATGVGTISFYNESTKEFASLRPWCI